MMFHIFGLVFRSPSLLQQPQKVTKYENQLIVNLNKWENLLKLPTQKKELEFIDDNNTKLNR